MRDETYDEFFEFSSRRKDNSVTPIILEYFTLERYGLKEEDALELLQERYRKD